MKRTQFEQGASDARKRTTHHNDHPSPASNLPAFLQNAINPNMGLKVMTSSVLLFQTVSAVELPPPEKLKLVTVCSDDSSGRLRRICEWKDAKVVEKIFGSITRAIPTKVNRAVLESGPILVFCDGSEKPVIGIMQTLDGLLAVYEIKTNRSAWILGKELTKPGEKLDSSKDQTTWSLVYKTWLLSVNPERFDLEQAREMAGSRPNPNSEGSDKPIRTAPGP